MSQSSAKKSAPKSERPPRRAKHSGVNRKAVNDSRAETPVEEDPFAEFHHSFEPIQKRKSQPPTE